MKMKDLTNNVSRNISINSKLWNLINQYKRYKKLVDTFDGDDNLTAHYYYYYQKMCEVQLNAYQLMCATDQFDLMILIDM